MPLNLQTLRQNWNKLVVFATSIMTALSRFVVQPPAAGNKDIWFDYGTYMVAILAGLWLFPVRHWAAKRHAVQWWVVAACFAILSFAAFWGYNTRLQNWSVVYFRSDRIVIGSRLTAEATIVRDREIAAGRPADDWHLLRSFAGDVLAVYDRSDVENRQSTLELWYLASLLTLASSIITVSQAIYC